MTQNFRDSHTSSTSSSSCPTEESNEFGQLRRPRRQPPPLPDVNPNDRQRLRSPPNERQIDHNQEDEEDLDDDDHQQQQQQRVQSYDSVHTENTLDTLDTVDTNRLDEEEELDNDDEEESGHELFGQRRSCLGYIVKTLCRRLDYFDDENEIHLDFLTATQLQRIIDTYKSRFRLSHPNLVYSQSGLPSYSNLTTAAIVITSSSSNRESFFGIDVNDIERRTGGLQLPPFIEQLLLYLMRTGAKSIGIFRKSGVKSRIATLKECCDRWPDLGSLSSELLNDHQSYDQMFSTLNLEANQHPAEEEQNRLESLLNKFSVFDVADTLKMWLRELRPGPLISQAVVLAYKDLVEGHCSTQEFHLNLFSLLTDAQRYVLLILLHMLSWFAQNCSQNHMTIQNLAICFAPSLCEIRRYSCSPSYLRPTSATRNGGNSQVGGLRTLNPKANYSTSFPHSNSLLNTTADNLMPTGISGSSSADSIYANEAEALNDAQKCLEHLIGNFEQLLFFSSDLLACSLESKKVSSNQLPAYNQSNGSVYLINGGNLLPQKYESSVSVTAAPVDILHRILYERNLLDPTLVKWDIGESGNKSNGEFADRFKVWKQSSIFLPIKKLTLNRNWSFFDPCENGKASGQSTNKPPKNPKLTSQGILLKEEGFLYQSVYKITTNGEGKSLVRHSAAFDIRGHSFFWYQKTFPSLVDFQLDRLRESFQVNFPKGKQKATNI